MLNRRTLAMAAIIVGWQVDSAIAPEARPSLVQTVGVPMVELFHAAQYGCQLLSRPWLPNHWESSGAGNGPLDQQAGD